MTPRALWLVALVLAGCRPEPRMVFPAASGVSIGTLTLQWSNVHVVFGESPLVVDSGTQGEFGEIKLGLAKLGAPIEKVKCAVITHAHADHSGTARAMQLAGVKIIAGAGDVERAKKGIHGAHNSTSVFATMLSWFLPEEYMPYTADVLVRDRYDLSTECGVAGEVIATPGHTAGHVVVLVAGGKVALVGDLFRGGRLAGFVDKMEPKVHFYQDDLEAAHRWIRELVRSGVTWFVLGHGGPSTSIEVVELFGSAP